MGKTQGKRKMWENREHRKVGSKKDVEKPGTHTKTIGKHEKISGKHRKQNMTFIGTTKMCFFLRIKAQPYQRIRLCPFELGMTIENNKHPLKTTTTTTTL